MSFITAVMVDATLPRGQDKIIGMTIYDKDSGDPYDVDGHTVTLFLTASWTDKEALLSREGNHVGDTTTGRVQFIFVPDDTEDLMCRAYDITVIVEDDATGQKWPALIDGASVGKIAVTPTVPEEVAE